MSAARYQLCWASLQRLSRRVAAWQQHYDAWITPVLATPPMKIGALNLEGTDLTTVWAPIAGYVPFTALLPPKSKRPTPGAISDRPSTDRS